MGAGYPACSQQRGSSQRGCPLSPLLFIVAVESVAIKLKNNPEIRGIQTDGNNPENRQNLTIKIKQFADDTTLTKKNENDIKVAIYTVEEFQEFSCLKLNRHKSEVIGMGSEKHKKGKIQDIPTTPWWGAVDAEIKVPSDENTELKCSPFKAWSRSVYSHTCYAYCQGLLPCLFLPFWSFHLHFFQIIS